MKIFIFNSTRKFILCAITICIAANTTAAETHWGPDASGGQDSPLIKRFTGSWLVGYKQSEWDETQMPTGMATEYLDKRLWKQTRPVEGKITRLFYLAPQGKTALEVYRNYEQALTGAGLQRKFSCEKDCSELYFAMDDTTQYMNGVTWANGSIPNATNSTSTYPINTTITSDNGRLLYGTLNKAGKELHILLYASDAGGDETQVAGTYLEIVEPKVMQTGQVTVDLKAMQTGLTTEGKIALYGIYFDTGKTEIKLESKAQLDEMAKLLQTQPNLKVYIVGHTDNQGTLETNLTLSLQRAQAISNALINNYKIDAKRLQARGVANLAPIASNTTDAGRSRNRRVELVAQ